VDDTHRGTTARIYDPRVELEPDHMFDQQPFPNCAPYQKMMYKLYRHLFREGFVRLPASVCIGTRKSFQ
jgi:hypothetical protein